MFSNYNDNIIILKCPGNGRYIDRIGIIDCANQTKRTAATYQTYCVQYIIILCICNIIAIYVIILVRPSYAIRTMAVITMPNILVRAERFYSGVYIYISTSTPREYIG